jgi:hypothetical protein
LTGHGELGGGRQKAAGQHGGPGRHDEGLELPCGVGVRAKCFRQLLPDQPAGYRGHAELLDS